MDAHWGTRNAGGMGWGMQRLGVERVRYATGGIMERVRYTTGDIMVIIGDKDGVGINSPLSFSLTNMQRYTSIRIYYIYYI